MLSNHTTPHQTALGDFDVSFKDDAFDVPGDSSRLRKSLIYQSPRQIEQVEPNLNVPIRWAPTVLSLRCIGCIWAVNAHTRQLMDGGLLRGLPEVFFDADQIGSLMFITGAINNHLRSPGPRIQAQSENYGTLKRKFHHVCEYLKQMQLMGVCSATIFQHLRHHLHWSTVIRARPFPLSKPQSPVNQNDAVFSLASYVNG
ncbi:uncharacterized protein BDR25DRAFT_348918 [Lindgomyces ingoldianus]|uniref:Uncharacterized protein n=1 Tax=Lindgomyces ingoldianus TaxID=673940 RepID=A0ACB6RFB6_9PLEO|nr:uncharacterized protein BDR25DRAFT_348918 [Lindgomyces ingoldianus]KAF2477022.1 hypothetical protein BDR25DRAFT_348918 [Lindgomyces ingoldianus]